MHENNFEPINARLIKNLNSHLPDVCKQYIDVCEKNIKASIQEKPSDPVMKSYESEVRKIQTIIRNTKDMEMLEECQHILLSLGDTLCMNYEKTKED